MTQKPASAGFLFDLKYIMPSFITPPGYSGTAELTASTGLTVVDLARYTFNQDQYVDGATFGLSLWPPDVKAGGTLQLQAQNWTIAVIGNDLTSYTDPDTHVTYPASQCRITVTGRWQVIRRQNSDSYNSFGVIYAGNTQTDLGSVAQGPDLKSYWSPYATYVIQGSGVDGGAQDTFSGHVFSCSVSELTSTENSNGQYQSNSITRPVWVYSYSKSWQV